MRILLSITEGYMLSETSKPIYSPGFTRQDLQKSEHQALCDVVRLAETRLVQEGMQVISRRYDDLKFAEFPFDKARHSKGCDLAVLIALNVSPKDTAQFATGCVNMIQDENSKRLFESMMASLQRFMPVETRYPNQMKRIPFLQSCARNGVPAMVLFPFFISDKKLNNDLLGQYIQATARSLCEGILYYQPGENNA